MRAMSRRAWRSRVVFSREPVADWKRRLNSSFRVSASLSASSSALMLRRSLARKEITALALHELGLDRELLPREAERLLGQRLRHARELEHHAARLDHGDPALGGALALAHPGLERLLRVRLVR